MPTLSAAAVTRPTSAPHATRVDTPPPLPRLSSPTSAPANAPANAPITEPTIGIGKPKNAPTMPPITAPQPARREPPYFFAYFAARVHSSHSATAAMQPTITTEVQPTPPAGTSSL